MESGPWSPAEVVGYEVAGDVVHALSALCTARMSEVSDPQVIKHWRDLAADCERRWRALDPGDVQAVEALVAECRDLVRTLTRQAR